MNMSLRPIIEGETEWDLDDDLEPADLSYLEQVADRDGPWTIAMEAWEKVKTAHTMLEECIDTQINFFKSITLNTDARVADDMQADVEDMWRSLNPHTRQLWTARVFDHCGLPKVLLKSVDEYMAPKPMHPPATEPSSDSYITEIRVHFRNVGEEDENRGFYGGRNSATVSGLVLRYSDGTLTKTGDLRDTICPFPIILMMSEHIVGVKEHKGGTYDEEVIGLSFYATDMRGINRHFEVYAHERLLCQEFGTSPPHSSSVIADDEMVIHTLTWCPEKKCIDGHTTRPTPTQCPDPFDNDAEPEDSRVAGFSYYPYDPTIPHGGMGGNERDYPWEEYVNNEDYLWDNHVPSEVISDIENVVQGISTESKFHDESNSVFEQAVAAFNRSNEVHNICTLVTMISKSIDTAKRDKWRRELERQFKALENRVDHIRRQMQRLIRVKTWAAKYEMSAEKDRESIVSLEMSKKLARVLDKHNLSDQKSLLVCAWCPGLRIFDPRHVPSWNRCIHPGCASVDLPCCGIDHVGYCKECHEPVCHYHLVYTDIHKKVCQKTLSSRCGFRGNGSSLDTACCGKIIDSNEGKECAGKDCEVVCCSDCRTSCKGWDRQCTCISWTKCDGRKVGCKAGHIECCDESVFCKACVKEHGDSRHFPLRCNGCYDRNEKDTISDMSDDSNYESESSESDEDFVADLNANEEGWTAEKLGPRYLGLSFPDE